MERRVDQHSPSKDVRLPRIVTYLTQDELFGRVPMDGEESAVVIENDPRRTDPSFGIAHDNARHPLYW
jgi:hypothetical protein